MRVVIVRRELGVAPSMDVYANNLVAELKQLRPTWEITEIAPQPWSDSQENLWHSGTGFRKYYERFWSHPQQVCQIQGDVYHIIDHSNAHVAYWLKKTGKTIVVTCHDLVQFVYPEILKGQSRFPAFSMASWQYSVMGMRDADHVIAVSSNTAKDVAKMLMIPPERITVVPNGVESFFRPLPSDEVATIRQQYEGSAETFCLLNVGSTHQRKNIPTILKALVMLRDRGMAIRLWKVGDEFTKEQTAFIQSHNLEEIITFIGKSDKALLVGLYNAADALIAPSLYEGFGLTVLEAMACGIPVISANVSSLPEVTGDAAILVDPLDVEEIANAVYSLRKDQALYQSYIEKGFTRAKLFSWTKSIEHVAQIYETLKRF
ncbi:D-inositol 3-phosphate glycosyltransferase [Tumidithrix helvetica PCC 7403]|uniref:glycosyltransferase family 4 protein n=1 Tax=Tumidithrix helvetica TaxID=3457545 RepID=UPI003C7F1824